MSEPKFLSRFLVAAWAGVLIVVVFCVWLPGPPYRVTLGQLATKLTDRPVGPVKVLNCSGGVRHGNFYVFKAPNETRYPVVLVLDADVPTGDVMVFVGSCAGIRVTPMAGCPCETPFVLVTGCVASSD